MPSHLKRCFSKVWAHRTAETNEEKLPEASCGRRCKDKWKPYAKFHKSLYPLVSSLKIAKTVLAKIKTASVESHPQLKKGMYNGTGN